MLVVAPAKMPAPMPKSTPKTKHSATVTATPKSTVPAASRFKVESLTPQGVQETRAHLQADGVHEEDETELLDEGTEGRLQVVAEVGKDEAGEQGSRDAQAEPPDPDTPQSQPRGCHERKNDDTVGDGLGVLNIGQPDKQDSFP